MRQIKQLQLYYQEILNPEIMSRDIKLKPHISISFSELLANGSTKNNISTAIAKGVENFCVHFFLYVDAGDVMLKEEQNL